MLRGLTLKDLYLTQQAPLLRGQHAGFAGRGFLRDGQRVLLWVLRDVYLVCRVCLLLCMVVSAS